MVIVLLLAGIALLTAGLVAIGYGIPVKEFSFGNTLIFSGTLVACTGMIMLALWMVVQELRNIARQFGPGNPVDLDNGLEHEAQEDRASFIRRDQPAALSPAPPPWQDDAAPPDRRNAPAGEIEPSSKQRRSLLFSSSARKERERAQGRSSELPAAALRPALPDAASSAGTDDLAPSAFEDAWPKSERSRKPDAPARRSGRTPTRFAGAGAGAAGPAGNADRPQVSVLKSGVVDGMAYSLYSDGSIEAQLPEGMMRFASIEELRSHLDQRP